MPSTHTTNKPLILDGATGTELTRRGADLSHPGWTARLILDAPDLLFQVHRDYVVAGADIITANTFRTHARNLAPLGMSDRALELTCQAVEIARAAAGSSVLVAGSVAPVGDCYSPHASADLATLEEAHEQMAEHQKQAGVDLILIETQVTIAEAVIACRAAQKTGLPFWVSFVTNSAGNVISGESLIDAYRAVSQLNPAGFLLNCVPADEVLLALAPVQEEFPSGSFGAYANTGRLLSNGTWESTNSENPAVYAEFVKSWIAQNFRIIGGCCGTGPDHISALLSVL